MVTIYLSLPILIPTPTTASQYPNILNTLSSHFQFGTEQQQNNTQGRCKYAISRYLYRETIYFRNNYDHYNECTVELKAKLQIISVLLDFHKFFGQSQCVWAYDTRTTFKSITITRQMHFRKVLWNINLVWISKETDGEHKLRFK